MRYARRLSFSTRLLSGALPLCAALALGCHGNVGSAGNTGTGGSGGVSITGAGGMDVPCAGNSDPRLVVAPQRIALLTTREVVNTVGYLIDSTIATQVLQSGMFNVTADVDRHFPPADGEPTQIPDTTSLQPWNNLAQSVSQYVFDNFATVTKCTTATDSCATTYLNGLAAKAYRRQLTSAETTRFTNLYNTLKSQMINGYQVTGTVQQAVQYSVYALLMTPQMVWRWELGDPNAMSTAPAGIYLTDNELASQLSFFLTDTPPDDQTLAAAQAGTLRANLASHVSRILATQASKDWLRTVISTFYLLNQLPAAINGIDPSKFPAVSSQLGADMLTESNKFLDNALWSGKLTDLLLSRTAFLNTGLASTIYNVPAPAGATGTNFVQTTLPSDQRSGIMTNAAFLTARARSDGMGLVIPRGKAVKAAFMCLQIPPPPDSVTAPGGPLDQAKAMFSMQTGQQQVAYRASIPLCKGCHGSFDQFGLVLENYDNLARWRTTYDYLNGVAIDPSTTMPPELGGGPVKNAVDMAQQLANSPAFVNCMSTAMLQYAMVNYSSFVQTPTPPSQSGCAAADVATRFNASSGKTFTDLINAVAASPSFTIRSIAQ